jgi:hypothetical protein
MLLKDNRRFQVFVNKTPKFILIGSLLFSFMLALLYSNSSLVQELNNLLNGRIRYSYYYLTNYKPTLFGQPFKTDMNAILDNGYIILYIQNGLIGLSLILYILFHICLKSEREMDIKKNILLVVFLIYIITESFSPNIFMNFILLFYSTILYKKELQVEERINE